MDSRWDWWSIVLDDMMVSIELDNIIIDNNGYQG